jgi:ribosome-associated protein
MAKKQAVKARSKAKAGKAPKAKGLKAPGFKVSGFKPKGFKPKGFKPKGLEPKAFQAKAGKKAPARGPKASSHRPEPARKPRTGKDAVLAHHATPTPQPKRPANDAGHANALFVANAGLDKKAEDVLLLDVRGLTSYADYFVIMTADSDRQASAIADHVDQKMKERGVSKIGSEGYETGRWILVDYGDVVAHVMSPESRELYDLEGLWADAPRTSVDG